MDETRPEKMSVMLNDSQMYCRRNMRRLDLVSKLTTAQPNSIQRARRNLLKSFESSNNSLTAASGAALNSIKSYEILEKVNSISFNRIMTNISQTMKHKWYSLYDIQGVRHWNVVFEMAPVTILLLDLQTCSGEFYIEEGTYFFNFFAMVGHEYQNTMSLDLNECRIPCILKPTFSPFMLFVLIGSSSYLDTLKV